MVDACGTKTDAHGRPRKIEAARAAFDVIRLARAVVSVILNHFLGRLRAIVVLSGTLDSLAGFVIVLAIVVVL